MTVIDHEAHSAPSLCVTVIDHEAQRGGSGPRSGERERVRVNVVNAGMLDG